MKIVREETTCDGCGKCVVSPSSESSSSARGAAFSESSSSARMKSISW